MKIAAWELILSHALLRMTAPSAEGAFWGEPRLRTREISPLRRRGGGRSPSGSFPIAPATPSGPTYRLASNLTLAGRGGSVSRRDLNRAYQRPHPTLRRNQVSRNRPTRTPAALREGARGRGFSQRSRLPRIPPGTPYSPSSCMIFTFGSCLRERTWAALRLATVSKMMLKS